MAERRIVRYFDGGLPVNRCNLRCEYCYVSQDEGIGWDNSVHESLNYTLEQMRFALRMDRLGGPCMFNFVASGETLLFKQIFELVEMIISIGHYARIVTNGTYSKGIEKLCTLSDKYKENLTIKFSMHYLELKKKNLLDTFFNNIKYVKENGISYSVELCASDEFIPYISEIKSLCMEHVGALPQVVELRNQEQTNFPRLTKLKIDEYRKIWSQFDSPLFNFETQEYEQYQSRFCYGGDYGITFSWKTGEASQCSCPGNKKIFNLFDNPETNLIFAAVGNNCPSAHCFTNYVWSVLVGNYEVDNRPTYSQERNRKCLNGEQWLSPSIEKIYSQRCSDHHKKYSVEKKMYINALMNRMYNGIEPSDVKRIELAQILTKRLQKYGSVFRYVAIYGFGGMGHWIYNILALTDIQVKFAIDRRAKIMQECVPVYDLQDANFDEIDAIIVSVYADYNTDYQMISAKTRKPILSILQLADE